MLKKFWIFGKHKSNFVLTMKIVVIYRTAVLLVVIVSVALL